MDTFADLHPDDGVLIGVINHPRDLAHARAGWYRVPVARYRSDLSTQAIAVVGFFLSRAFGVQNGGVAFFARKRGVELVTRRMLLPHEAGHVRADHRYYRVALGELTPRVPPIINPTRRTIAFILTSWGEFVSADIIADLYRVRRTP